MYIYVQVYIDDLYGKVEDASELCGVCECVCVRERESARARERERERERE
jgi:hypothetical protein